MICLLGKRGTNRCAILNEGDEMTTDEQMLAQIDAAEQFIDKDYLEALKEYRVHPLDERLKSI